jgi:chloramphenicol 3-O phosphotransferase
MPIKGNIPEMNSVAIVLNGASSAGKTSIAKAIQRLAGTPVLYVSLDTFTDMFHWPAVTNQEERKECHRVGVTNFHVTLPILASSRFPLVVDHVFEQHAWYEACHSALKDRKVYFVGVRCPLAVLEVREKARGDRRIGMARFQADRVHEQKQYALEVDTSIHSPEECATAILRFIESAEKTNQSLQPTPSRG